MMDRKDDRIVDGYLFRNAEDAEIALQEKRKIEYLEKHMNFSSALNILEVYKKANDGKIFVTPVGCTYLRKLQKFLLQCDEINADDVPPLEVSQTYMAKMRKSYTPVRQYVKPSDQRKPKWPFFSVIANILLALAVAGMFGIALKSDNPNILNYEKAITNKYAYWEQDLSKRESVIREKERELKIEVD